MYALGIKYSAIFAVVRHTLYAPTSVVMEQRRDEKEAEEQKVSAIASAFLNVGQFFSRGQTNKSRPWVTSSETIKVSIYAWTRCRDSLLFSDYLFRRGTMDSARQQLQVGVPKKGGVYRQLSRDDGTVFEVSLDPAVCFEFSVTLILPGHDLFWPVVPPLQFLELISQRAVILADQFISSSIMKRVSLSPIMLFPKNTFMPGYWSPDPQPGRYRPKFQPTRSEQHFMTVGKLVPPFQIDLHGKKNNFMAGIAVGFHGPPTLTGTIRALTEQAIHNAVAEVVRTLEPMTVVPITLKNGTGALMGLTSDNKGLRILIKPALGELARSPRRRRSESRGRKSVLL